MKKVTTILLALIISATGFAQGTVQNQPYTFNGGITNGGFIRYASETAAAHNYTILGKPVVYVTATRKDTLNLLTTNYKTGQTISLITTTSANDSTLIIPSSGNIMGASTYWYVGAASTYKHSTIIFDGTNYWVK